MTFSSVLFAARSLFLGACLVLFAAPAGATGMEQARKDAEAKVAAIMALTPDDAYGAYLAGDCVTCHRPSGGDGIPPIAGLPAEHIVNALVEYQLKIRGNEVMVVRTSRLSDDEIAALASHFSQQTN